MQISLFTLCLPGAVLGGAGLCGAKSLVSIMQYEILLFLLIEPFEFCNTELIISEVT